MEEVGHLDPKSWVNSGANENAVVGESANEEKEGTGDNSIGSQALGSSVPLGSCNVDCF